ncbi:relaxase/mobilization nuclease domain-containing protein [Burkholderia sp. 22PA0106]|uniref:plasmid recombination protein n=1 Tax=Burkholderia sp. 22PA0106 TaxID=3237371 RepID=UPI0039C4B13A
MGYQFYHIEGYARETSKQKKKGNWNARDIINEVKRSPGACDHVDSPEPPTLLYGVAPEFALQEAEKWAEQATDLKGRKLRKDASCLMAGVISLPRAEEHKWEKFKQSSIKWLQHKYGDRLRSVVEHTDEPHPHIHFYVVPRIGERFEVVHDGIRAREEAKANNVVKGKQNMAYIKAMRALQNQFGLDVASRYGLTRLGPKRRRLTRKEWKIEQQNAEYNGLVNTRRIEAEAKGYKNGEKRGFNDGYSSGVAKASKTGKKAGNFLTGMMAALHQPTQKAKEQAENSDQKAKEEKKRRLEAEDKAKHAKKLAQSEFEKQYENELDMLRSEIQKKDRIIESQDKDIERINKELASYGAIYRANPEKHRKNAV